MVSEEVIKTDSFITIYMAKIEKKIE